MAYEAFIHIREFKPAQIIGSAGASVGLILVLQELFKNTGFFSELDVDTSIIKIIYFSIFFIGLYVLLFFCYRKYHDMKAFFTYLLILLVFCELTLNMSVTGIPSTSSRSGYYEARATYDELNKAAEDMAKAEGVNFYRTEGEYHATRNDGARFGYDSVSTFSSVASAAIQDYYDEIGMQTSFNAYSYYGHTPLTAAMQSIKYEYATGSCSLPNNMTLVNQKTYKTKSGQSTLKLYKYNNTLPLGFMMNTGTEASWDKKSGNPFATQNNFVRTAVNGGKNIFHQLKSSAVGTFSAKYALEANDKYTPDPNQIGRAHV